MNRLYFIFLIAILASCGNSPKTEKIAKEKLDANLVSGVLKVINTKEHLKFPDIPLNESFIIVSFEVKPEEAIVNLSDTIVNIYHYNNYDYNEFMSYDNINDYYKGILDIEGYNVAIFDFGNFGEKYYDAGSLKQIPLDRFKPYTLEYILTNTFYVENGKIRHWQDSLNFDDVLSPFRGNVPVPVPVGQCTLQITP